MVITVHPKLLLIVLVLLASTVACSRAPKTDSKGTQKEDTTTAATKDWRAEQSRRIWRRSTLRHQLENDELDLSIAKTKNHIAELEGKPQTATPTILAQDRLLSDRGAMQMDADFDEMDQNFVATGASSQELAENTRERVEIDELLDLWDARLRAVKTVRESHLSTAARAKAVDAKLGEFQARLEDALQRAQHASKRDLNPSNAGK